MVPNNPCASSSIPAVKYSTSVEPALAPLPKPRAHSLDFHRAAVRSANHAAKFAAHRIEGGNFAATKLADQKQITEAAKIGRRERHTQGASNRAPQRSRFWRTPAVENADT